jgi:(E)-4-hydroxy-3-methylbut-2-enyl-diphosphate synthase
VPQERLVDELFAEIDRSLEAGRTVVDEHKAAEGAAWLRRIEEENADELTPERIAAMEAAAASESGEPLPMAGSSAGPTRKPVRLDEEASPTAGRRFSRV